MGCSVDVVVIVVNLLLTLTEAGWVGQLTVEMRSVIPDSMYHGLEFVEGVGSV